MHSSGQSGDQAVPLENLPPVSEASLHTAFHSHPQSPGSLPESIGPYRILGILGAGGMGVVYRARQEQPSREVALKVIKPGTAGLEQLRRFQREAEILGRFQHSGIARIYEAGQIGAGHGAQRYLVMELIEGRPLTTHADEQKLGIRDRSRLMIEVCEAVKHAHQKGVIHGDLKPANILVDHAGQPKVLDFGLARITDGETVSSVETAPGRAAGTPAYMSPEQVMGDSLSADTLSDVYALGVILYEILAGHRPHVLKPGIGPEEIRELAANDPRPLGSLNRQCRGDLEAIASKALERDRSHRYQSVTELTDDLNRYLNLEPVMARGGGNLYRAWKYARRHAARVIPAAILFVAILAALPLGAWAMIQKSQAELARGRAELAEIEKARLEAEGFIQNARLAARKGQWREALVAYDNALATERFRDSRPVRLGKVRALLAINDYSRAAAEIEVLANAQDLGEEEGSVRLMQGVVLLGRDDARAEQYIEMALAKGLPDGERAYASTFRATSTPQAIELLRRAVAFDPFQQRARLDLTLLLILSARLDEATSELNTHAVLFPEDPEAIVLQALLLALQRKHTEVESGLDRLRGRMPDRDIAALRALTTFLSEFLNPSNKPHHLIGLPTLPTAWQTLTHELRKLGPGNSESSWVGVLSPVAALTPISRLPPRLRKGLLQVLNALEAVNTLWDPAKLPTVALEVTEAAKIHPEGTVLYMKALSFFGAENWKDADQTARLAAETPALFQSRRPALFIAGAAEFMLYSDSRGNPDAFTPTAVAAASLGRLVSPGVISAIADVYRHEKDKTEQALLRQAVGNLREMLTLGPHRPLKPEIAVAVAALAREYSLARQLLDDWEKEAGPFDRTMILYFRAYTEFEAGSYGSTLKYADQFLRSNPKAANVKRIRDSAVEKLKEEARKYLPESGVKH